jgi:outer membrane protein OmpA-like peptidoglycan-associated protein
MAAGDSQRGIAKMGGSALEAPVLEAVRTRADNGSRLSPAAALLDALQSGDDQGVLAACCESTTVTADAMGWSCTGLDQIEAMLVQTRNRFPGLVYESRTRRIGFGLVIEEARVRDVTPEDLTEPGAAESAIEAIVAVAEFDGVDLDDGDDLVELGIVTAPDHPMYDVPEGTRGTEVQLWRDLGDGPAAALNLPVRVTVRHDDLQVHEVILSFPAALVKRALGMHVDPLEMSLCEIQSAFIAPVGAGFTTETLAGSEPGLSAAPDTTTESDAPPRRRRRRGRRLLALLLLAAILGGGAWYVSDRGVPTFSTGATSPRTSPSASVSPSVSPSAPVSPATSAGSDQEPTVTHSSAAGSPTRKPNVTLRSDLAFGFDSARLSPQAKTAIAQVARQVLRADLSGKIYVDGYTDDLGSASHGRVLSQQRADAVSAYLQSQLAGSDVSIVSVGHGEAHPLASNATAHGREANRRVTITLPRS